MDEAQRHADEVQEDHVHGESQQFADAQERIWGLEEDLANTDELREDYVHRESQRLADAQERIRWLEKDLANRVDELCGEKNKVEWFTRLLEYEKSELNIRIEEEQISNSRDRKSLEKEWKKS